MIVDHEAALPIKGADGYGFGPRRNWRCYSAMPAMLWAEEARAVCRRQRISVSDRTPMRVSLPQIARLLTGEQIIAEVCRELRARDAFWKADPPIHVERPEPAPAKPASGQATML